MKQVALLALLASVCTAGEYAVLQSGFRIAAEQHELIDGTIRLHTKTGTLDFPAEQVIRFEQEEYVAPKPAVIPEAAVEKASADAKPLTPQEVLQEAAEKYGVRAEFIRSLAAVESAYRADAVSPKGALGLMQLMPGTAQDLGVDPHDPRQNADGGVRYIKELLLKYKDHPDPVRMALAAYNAGPGAVDRYGKIPPYRETQAYVEKVLRRYLNELKPKS
ncbi:MAG TPA: lytic transglycosylase domain-containing protein [Bryobacteraceae bacterium]|nr:lytic transglycosylase domain-containing protein [Bryobacteraceae bacterium]